MSNEHWGSLGFELEERWKHVSEALTLLTQIAYTLNAGHSGDACYECAKVRTIAALETFFDGDATDSRTAVEILLGTSGRIFCERHGRIFCERHAPPEK